MPRFPIGITKKTFSRAAEFLDAIGYTGPVCISCDDTQLLSKFVPYHDAQQDQWYIVGGVGDPVAVDGDVEDIEAMMTKVVGSSEKATKVSVFGSSTYS
jgi:hypothetical protein